MGNNLSTGTGTTATGTVTRYAAPLSLSGNDSVLGELGSEVQYDKSIGTSRFLKTIRARHREGALVVKVFVKPDPTLSLKAFQRRIKMEKEALANCPNILTYQRHLETERAGYLMRQWVASNLYDRISTRPFLSLIEKRWVAFQLLSALKHARDHGVAHGDIKTENVLVTSWNWIYLTDFASFKPVYLPLDNPATYSYYYDTSSRRTCYIAPERFYAPGSELAKKKDALEFGKRDGRVLESMDVFSTGCVLAELWMEGSPPFTLSQLYKYKEGEYDPSAYLAEIEDVEIRDMIKSMISLDPNSRLTFEAYLNKYRDIAFPSIFYDFLHPFISSLNTVSSLTDPSTSSPSPAPGTSAPTVNGDSNRNVWLKSDADERIDTIWNEWESVKRYLDQDRNEDTLKKEQEEGEAFKGVRDDLFPVHLNIPGAEGQVVRGGISEDGPAIIILSLVCANVRNCLKPASMIKAIEILLALNRYLTDETMLDRLLPYLVSLLEDDSAGVRAAAIKALTQTLTLIRTITPSNAAIFPEYILPNTRSLSSDAELLPRTTYASCLPVLAKTAVRFLELKEAMKSEGSLKPSNAGNDFEGGDEAAESYDSQLLDLQLQIQDHLSPLLNDSPSVVKRALLLQVGELCRFFGKHKANDAILAHLMTYLNERDWLLRKAWNEHAIELATCVGVRSLEEYILPMIYLSLSDSEETVTATVLNSLTALVERHLLAKAKIWEVVGQVTAFLCHPNIWIREGAAAFLATVAKLLQPADRWCILYPTVKRLLRADIKDITELSILDNARDPLSRVVFEAAVAWATRSPRAQFWTSARPTAKPSSRSDEDHAQLDKLRSLGMKPEDEYKLSMLKEYISRLASARRASSSRTSESAELVAQTGHIKLSDLGVVPQTFIFRLRSSEEIVAETHGIKSPLGPRRFSLDTPRSPSSLDSRTPRHVSQPLDDLRKRLALHSASSTSVNSPIASAEPGTPTSPSPAPAGSPSTKVKASDLPTLERTTSLASSSTTTDDPFDMNPFRADLPSASKPKNKVHSHAVDVGRVAPAIAQDSTNVMGHFDVESRLHDEDAMSAVSNLISGTPQEASTPLPSTLPTQRFVSTYEGNDPKIKQLLERVYLDTYRDDLPEFGPRVQPGIPRRRALRTSFPPREKRHERPQGTLIAHLKEHTAAITTIQVSPDQLFFVTGSEDGTVKIWDSIRLEKNVTSPSRHTYQQGGKVTAVCLLEKSHCIASASTNGTLLIHRVDISLSGSMPKYGKHALIRQRTEDFGDYVTCMTAFNTDTTTNLILGTAQSRIEVLDVRTMRPLQQFQNAPHHGPITCLCVDTSRVWVVVGTATGSLSLWDLRFGLLLRTWNVSSSRILQLGIHPSKGKGRWIIVTTEDQKMEDESKKDGLLVAEVWDVERATKVEDFRVSQPSSSRPTNLFSNETSLTPASDSETSPAAAIEAFLASSSSSVKGRSRGTNEVSGLGTILLDAKTPRPGVRAFLAGINYSPPERNQDEIGAESSSKAHPLGYLLTGGEDKKIRFWDLEKVEKSAVVSGLDPEEDRPVYSAHTSTTRPNHYLESPYSSSSSKNRTSNGSGASKVHRSTFITNSQQQLLRGHQESITALAVLDLPFRCIVSGDRGGVVKVFD